MNYARPETINAFVSALSEEFQAPINLFEGYSAIHFEDGRRLNIAFGEAGVMLTVPLPKAHDGLPQSILIELLKMNFVGLGSTGMTLCCSEGMDHLEIAGSVSFSATSAVGLATIADGLVRAATMIDAWLETECRAVINSEL